MTKLLSTFDAIDNSAFQQNRQLFSWLCDEQQRATLYRELLQTPRVLQFTSRADTKARASDPGDSQYHQTVYLLTQRSHIEQALTDSSAFSNSPYLALGSGTFMLGLDKDQPTPATDEHKAQRQFAMSAFKYDGRTIAALSALAYQAASVLPLKTREFDLAYLSEQAALRFVGFLFGFAQSDIGLLEQTMRMAYNGMSYQMFARHFVANPLAVPQASGAMGMLLVRVGQLLDQYQQAIGKKEQDDVAALQQELKELQTFAFPPQGATLLKDFEPILPRLARTAAQYSGTELAAIVVGSIAGIIGNVQASVSIAISQFFTLGQMPLAQAAALRAAQNPADAGALSTLILEALRLQPPAPFLPRRVLKDDPFNGVGGVRIPAGSLVILAVGAATRDDGQPHPHEFRPTAAKDDPLIFGGDPGDHLHQCLGKYIAMPLVAQVVQQVLLLPGLAQTLDPTTGEPNTLQKHWGFNCKTFPLQFTADKRVIQQSLNVVMEIKKPLAVHAEALKQIIVYGAPRIELRLQQSRHVHFAFFEFLENDSKLVLHTIFDGDFDAYIEHFALQIGPLFDLLFEHIEHAPPLPVEEFPKEFIDAIRLHNKAPAARYFYSAYPTRTVADIVASPEAR